MTDLTNVELGEPTNYEGNGENVIKLLTETPSGNSDEGTLNTGSNANAASSADPFNGKSMEEVIEMYKNLERQNSMAHQRIGELQGVTNTLLATRQDNGNNANKAAAEDEIDPVAYYTDPVKATRQLLDKHRETLEKEMEARFAKVETSRAEQSFYHAHPDFNQIANSPEFAAWVKDPAHPTRIVTAKIANGGNYEAAHLLFTEFKNGKGAASNEERGLNAARNVGLDSSKTSGRAGGKSAPTLKQADLIDMQRRNPDLYYSEDMQAKILKAYAENRVV